MISLLLRLNDFAWDIYQSLLIRQQKRLLETFLFTNGMDANRETLFVGVATRQKEFVSVFKQMSRLAVQRRDWVEAVRRWAVAIYHILPVADCRARKARLTAEVCLSNGHKELARLVIQSYSPPEKFRDSYLALASAEIESPGNWLEYVNRFFAHSKLSPIRLDANSLPSSYSLIGEPSTFIANGPLVTVIMTAYNTERWIENAIRSILNQSWRNFELIVIDDCSTDSTATVAQRLMREDDRIKFFQNSVNFGAFVSRNIGVNLSNGEYLTCHDADDFAHPDRLRLQVEDLNRQPAHIGSLFCDVRMFEDGRFEPTYWGDYSTHRSCVSLMFRKRQALSIFGYWDSVRGGADSEYIDRIQTVLGSRAIIQNPKVLIVQLRRANSITTSTQTRNVRTDASSIIRSYQQSYLAWHRAIDSKSCYLPFPLQSRLFNAPNELIVPFSKVISTKNE